ncbi:methyl-accepting chemotaxis protein [Cyanobacterium aponinum AL20118]|uniref:Methyl-accepting chemotaxis protein n=1 Tax=Cyanobacterium aponinum AL20115 TaxID=3090662 RepID=A0AAF0ZEH8_9CHRO|nr:methyl-accepting chemotaxis protein [Cyanobacterium aponinum]WPF88888.1 methyl-accepting chemotaxis protein [Cyanobacterium aponinum AL20115]
MTQAPEKPSLQSTTQEKGNTSPVYATRNQKTPPVNTTPPVVKWFYDLSIRKKQLLVVVGAQAISFAVLLGVGVLEIVTGGREQLINQSISELEATKINYDIKINQMGFGFRGQSDNVAIINAALTRANGNSLTPTQQSLVKQILQNEITARNIEYATLVGRDQRIIVSANNNRAGEVFDPNGLVSQVINNPQQIKTTEIVSWQDLQAENPPLLPRLIPNQDVVIRYTFTPVFNPNNRDQVVGVLVSGDVVNGKYSIVFDTINEFKGGYSAVYQVNSEDNISLASSATNSEDTTNQLIASQKLLELALENPNQIVSFRDKVGDETFTFTAQTIQNKAGEPVAILVRGTPEKALNQIIANSLKTQGQTALIVLILNFILIIVLGRVIANRLEQLQKTTTQFAEGNYRVRANIVGQDEIGDLADTFNLLAENIESNETLLLLDAEKASLFQEITGARVVDEDDINQVFDRSLPKAKEILEVDRLVIYRFKPNWSGYISNEAGDQDLPSALSEQLNDPCIPLSLRDSYINGRVVATENVYTAGFAPEHEALMHRLQIKSNLVIPIISQGQLFALLIAHHCRQHHQWQEKEISFLSQIALRYGVILDRVNILKAQMTSATRAEQLKEITLNLAEGLSPQEVMNTAVLETRKVLKCDRSIVYEFDEKWQGTIIAESVAEGYPQALGAKIHDPCFEEEYVEKYLQGRVQATPDIHNAGLTLCHLKQLDPFEVKANLVAPIIVNRKLIGLLICHQCSNIREWELSEIDFMTQVATQVGLALERVKLIDLQLQAEQEQRQAKELLQQRALELLMQVDPVSKGDLTIRATVTEDEIGTIADSYNATIESLRQIVSQVQNAALEVAQTTSNNESDMEILRLEIAEQVENIAQALQTVNAMSRSSKIVAESAEQAEEALIKAQESVAVGDSAMNKTVRSIMDIRATVQQAADQVKKLGDTTENISNFVSLIGRFAAQTHLLALKASIEAARAGEQGQGFAVIADEVRALATQSAQATADIDKLVTDILSETKVVVTSMEEGNELVVEGSKLVEETRQSLNQITAATVQINELVEAIAAAAFEQSENSEEVSITMGDVAKVAEKTNSSVTQLSQSFIQLRSLARKLESDVAKFKVS